MVLVLVWAGWCWFFVREKHYWLAGLGWLKPKSEQADVMVDLIELINLMFDVLVSLVLINKVKATKSELIQN